MTLVIAAVAAGTAWAPIFLVRDWGLTPGEIGRTFGPISIVSGIAGTFAGGWIAARLAKAGRTDAALLATLFSVVGATIFGVLVFQSRESALGYVALAGITFFSPMPFGVALAVLSEIARPELRGRLTAIYIFTLNAVGQTLGPWPSASRTTGSSSPSGRCRRR
jgi:uncharacterized membrane protein YeaQ/YmgE (transglycosylase-associated protein family)